MLLCFIIFPAKSEVKLRLIFKSKHNDNNFEITQNDITKVKFLGREIVAHASKHDTGQKTFEWGTVFVSNGELKRFFYSYGENRLIIFRIYLSKSQLELIIKKSKEDKTGKEMEKLKAQFFYEKYTNNEEIEKLGEMKCKLKKKINY